jgi:putative DNA primase/helicase
MTDRERTIETVRRRGWSLVKLGIKTKVPIGKHWETTTDADQVARWLDTGHNLGLVCHQDTGIAVLDADVMLPWADMIEALGQPAAAWTLTGRGKLHYFIRWAPDLPAKLEWLGVKIGEIQRGPGLQQIVIPPSVHPDTGKSYEWLVDPRTQPLEPLPGLWRAYLTAYTFEKRYGRRH